MNLRFNLFSFECISFLDHVDFLGRLYEIHIGLSNIGLYEIHIDWICGCCHNWSDKGFSITLSFVQAKKVCHLGIWNWGGIKLQGRIIVRGFW